jgi:hypothetical protein
VRSSARLFGAFDEKVGRVFSIRLPHWRDQLCLAVDDFNLA